MHDAREVRIVYQVPTSKRGWELSWVTMPISTLHDEALTLLREILAHWASTRQDTKIVRNMGIYWDENNPDIGVDPDMSVLRPVPPSDEDGVLRSVRTWEPGHVAPLFAVEIVSDVDPHKDFVPIPDKYAASGTRELCIFDQFLTGPTSHGGPHRIQLWRRDESDCFERVYTGDGPVYSSTLKGYLVVVDDYMLRIAEDEAGLHLWPTKLESIHAKTRRFEEKTEHFIAETRRFEEETERIRAERIASEQVTKEALARIAVLEAALREATKSDR